MTSELAVATPEKLQFTEERIAQIKRTICPTATPAEFEMFLVQCQRRGLDPFAKQIYFNKYGNQAGANVTSIDGFRLIADRTGKYAPGRAATYVEDAKGLISATAYVQKFVAGQWLETSETCFFEEFSQNTPNWRKMPRVMLSKCAEARTLRRAFPEDLGGLYAAEEIERPAPIGNHASPSEVLEVEEVSDPRPELVERYNALRAELTKAGRGPYPDLNARMRLEVIQRGVDKLGAEWQDILQVSENAGESGWAEAPKPVESSLPLSRQYEIALSDLRSSDSPYDSEYPRDFKHLSEAQLRDAIADMKADLAWMWRDTNQEKQMPNPRNAQGKRLNGKDYRQPSKHPIADAVRANKASDPEGEAVFEQGEDYVPPAPIQSDLATEAQHRALMACGARLFGRTTRENELISLAGKPLDQITKSEAANLIQQMRTRLENGEAAPKSPKEKPNLARLMAVIGSLGLSMDEADKPARLEAVNAWGVLMYPEKWPNIDSFSKLDEAYCMTLANDMENGQFDALNWPQLAKVSADA